MAPKLIDDILVDFQGVDKADLRAYLRNRQIQSVADGGGTDTENFEEAASSGPVVWVPHRPGGYNVADTVDPGQATFILEAAQQLTGSASLADLRALVLNQGYWGGIPIADDFREGRIEIICGTIRKKEAGTDKWHYIYDSGHNTLGVQDPTQEISADNTLEITIPFRKTYSKVLAFLCGPDETLGGSYNVTVGASVSTSGAKLRIGGEQYGESFVWYDGAEWKELVVSGDLGNTYTWSAPNNRLLVSHARIDSPTTVIVPSINGANIPYMPIMGGYNVARTSFFVRFVDTTTGALVTVPDQRMSFLWSARGSANFILNGTDEGGKQDAILRSGNIWFFGIMQV